MDIKSEQTKRRKQLEPSCSKVPSFMKPAFFFLLEKRTDSNQSCDFHNTIPFPWPKRFWSWKFRRGGREALSGMLRNVVIVMSEYWEGNKWDARQDPEREPSRMFFPWIYGKEPHKFQCQVFRVLSKLEEKITSQKSQKWKSNASKIKLKRKANWKNKYILDTMC